MNDIFVVPSPLLQPASIVYEPHQVQVVKYNDHARAMCELERRVDTAYAQRNNAAVALVRMALLLGWPAGRGLDDKTDNDLAWRHVVYLDLPNGEQVSYHMAPADVPLLEGLPVYGGKWDGKFTGTTAWAGMVPEVPADVPLLGENLNAYAICFQGAEACTATGCGFMEAGNGEPGTPSEGVLDFDPAEVERLLREVPVGEMVQLSGTAWPKRVYSGPPSSLRLELPVPKAPFPPGVCACPKCDQPREVGKLFCAPHRSVDSRFRDPRPMTNERLAYMMQRDGEQQ